MSNLAVALELAAAGGVIIVIGLTLLRMFAGPTLYDRALSATAVATKVALVCAALAVAAGRPDWIDVSFAMVLATIVAQVAIVKFFRARSFQPPLDRAEPAREGGR